MMIDKTQINGKFSFFIETGPSVLSEKNSENVPLPTEIAEISETQRLSLAATRIQNWWRRVLQSRKLEDFALRSLLAQQKKRILSRSASRKANSLAGNRVFRSPRVATSIMKKMKNSEPVSTLGSYHKSYF